MQRDETTSETNQALQKIARGTGIVFAGTVVSMQSISDVTVTSHCEHRLQIRGIPKIWWKSCFITLRDSEA